MSKKSGRQSSAPAVVAEPLGADEPLPNVEPVAAVAILEPVAPAVAVPAAVAESGAAIPGVIKELRRDIAESQAVAIRTSNAVTTLAASLKEVITRQNRYDRGLNLNSFVAYVLFTALLGGGFYMLYRSRTDRLVDERDQAVRERKLAIDEATTTRGELATRDEAQRHALDYWHLLSAGKRDEAIARYGEVTHERLTPVEAAVFQQGVERARAEIVDGAFAEGLEAFQGQQWKRAGAAFQRGLKYEPDGPRAAQMHYYNGVSLHKLGSYAEASGELEKALDGGAERSVGPDARYFLASALEALRQYDRARSEYDKFAAGHPQHMYAPAARRKTFELAPKLKP